MSALEGSRRQLDRAIVGSSAILVALGLIFLVAPILIAVLLAFDNRNYLGPLPPPGFSLHWFERLFSQDYLAAGLATSLEIAILTTFINVAIGAAAAVGLERAKFPGKNVVLAAFLSPLIVPAVVTGFALLLFLSSMGVLNGFVRLLCGHVIITLPYTIRTTLTSLIGRDQRLTEAALVLGATESQAFWSVTIPLIRTGIVTGAVFAFAISMDDVSVSLFLTDPTTFTLPVALVANMRASFDLTIAAAAVIFIGITGVLIAILERSVGFDRLLGQGLFQS
jgi:putative spermidine/putrescine transport system permease protein